MTRYLTLGEYFWLAEQVTGIDAGVLAKVSRSDLADSALHAPEAGFGDEEFYPGIMKRQPFSYVGWRGITLFWTETSERHGHRSACSSSSTAATGNRNPQMLTQPKKQ